MIDDDEGPRPLGVARRGPEAILGCTVADDGDVEDLVDLVGGDQRRHVQVAVAVGDREGLAERRNGALAGICCAEGHGEHGPERIAVRPEMTHGDHRIGGL